MSSSIREFFPIVVGEWSLVHDTRAFGELTRLQRDAVARLIAASQIYVYEQIDGWFFWSYKLISDLPEWDFRRETERGHFTRTYR